MYKFYKNLRGDLVGVQKQEGGFLISVPFDPANTDYQDYLAWLAEGNIPFAADALIPQENGNTFTLSA